MVTRTEMPTRAPIAAASAALPWLAMSSIARAMAWVFAVNLLPLANFVASLSPGGKLRLNTGRGKQVLLSIS
ncbi:MAG: hypothetical protein Devi2KO_17930 [Devosia indica]